MNMTSLIVLVIFVVTGAFDSTVGTITNTTVPNTATDPGSDLGSSNTNITFDITRLASLAAPSKITSVPSKLIDWQPMGNNFSSGRTALNHTDGKVNSIAVNMSTFAGRIQDVSFLMNTTAKMKARNSGLLENTYESGLKFSAASSTYSTTKSAPSSTSTEWLKTVTGAAKLKILTASPRITARVSSTSALESFIAETTPDAGSIVTSSSRSQAKGAGEQSTVPSASGQAIIISTESAQGINISAGASRSVAIRSQNLTKSSAGFLTTTETIITNKAENPVPFMTVLPPMKSLNLDESSTIPSPSELSTNTAEIFSETSTGSYIEQTVNATVNANDNISLSTLMAADSNWSPSSISEWQFFEALSLIMRSVGGFGIPCWQAVPFISVPGLIIDTVEGVKYPSDFLMSFNTRLPSDFEISLGYVSCIVNLEEVQYSSNFSLLIQFEASLPILSKRMLTKVLSKDGRSLCQNGSEWRLTVVGAPDEFACSCPANMMCSGKTICTLTPKSGDSWAVRSMPNTLCVDSKILNRTQVNTSLHISGSNGNIKSFLIVGLSSCVSIVIFLAIALNIRRKGLPVDKNINLLEVGTNEARDLSVEQQSLEIDPSKFVCCDKTADVKDVIFSISDQISDQITSFPAQSRKTTTETMQQSLVPLPIAILRKMESEDAGSPISDRQFNDSCHSQSGEIKAELVITTESTRNPKSLQMSGWSPYKLESISSLVSQLLAKDTTSFV